MRRATTVCCSWAGRSLEQEPAGKDQLQQQDGWDTVAKLAVQGLVMPCLYADVSTQATACQCQQEQGAFGNAPSGVAGFPFVNAVANECDGVDSCQVNQNQDLWSEVVCGEVHSGVLRLQRYEFYGQTSLFLFFCCIFALYKYQ